MRQGIELTLKALAGAAVVLIIQGFSRTENYVIAGLVPLFPTFALISHLIVGAERTPSELKATILFGMFSLIPYLVYLAALYVLVDRIPLIAALVVAVACWSVAAMILIVTWNRLSNAWGGYP